MRLIIFIQALLVALIPISAVFRGFHVPQDSIFSYQCGDMISARVFNYSDEFTRSQRVPSISRLINLPYQEGIWADYSSPYPFGKRYPEVGFWHSQVLTRTSCGEMTTWAWDNLDGSMIIFVFLNMDETCDASGQHCGQHNVKHYYVEKQVWMRATGQRHE